MAKGPFYGSLVGLCCVWRVKEELLETVLMCVQSEKGWSKYRTLGNADDM